MIVVDASALVEILLRTPAAPAAATALVKGTTVRAPRLVDVEVALAEALDVPLLTYDSRLRTAARRHSAVRLL
jgi:predicted nucleic acid-binding protein